MRKRTKHLKRSQTNRHDADIVAVQSNEWWQTACWACVRIFSGRNVTAVAIVTVLTKAMNFATENWDKLIALIPHG